MNICFFVKIGNLIKFIFFCIEKNIMVFFSFFIVCLFVFVGCVVYVIVNGYGQLVYSYVRLQIYVFVWFFFGYVGIGVGGGFLGGLGFNSDFGGIFLIFFICKFVI